MQTTAIIDDVIRMSKAARRLAHAMKSLAGVPLQDACGLTPKELILLRTVEGGSAFPHELSDRTDTPAPLVTRAIDRLVELGYVERRPDTEDRRRVALVITEAGARASADGWKAMRGVIANAFQDVQLGALRRLAEEMEALSDAVEEKGEAVEAGARERAEDAGRRGVSA